ncbi:MAG TPA: dihydrodipicolinate synthase family protein [Clostridia bacterium]|nr:dihydrodipicolinate synthase family protein [Clostridia bacterium]
MIKNGVWVTMITPFHDDGTIDFDAIPAMVDFYAAHCDGIFAVCQSSEMFFLDVQERVRLAKAVVRAAAGRLPVIVSGHTASDPAEQLEELREMAQTGAEALVLVANRMAAAEEDDARWIERADALVKALPEISLGIYECPYPYKRLMTAETLRWCAQTGRFAFLKDTCCHSGQIREKLRLLEGTPFRLFNANTATLLESLRDGCFGYSGVMANFHPQLYRRLIAWAGENPAAAEELQAQMTLMSWVENRAYPACAKLHMRMLGLPVQPYCRNGAHLRMSYDTHLDVAHLLAFERKLLACIGAPDALESML